MAQDTYDLIQQLRASGHPFAIATVVETQGSVSAKTASKAVVDEQGRIVAGWVGGGCAESATCHAALHCIETGQPTLLDIDLVDEVFGAGMPCGGRMRVFVEPVLPRPALWILGHGQVAECLCAMADLLGVETVVIDPLADRDRFPVASRLVADDDDYSQLTPSSDDFVVIATQHKGDHLSVKRALASSVRYIALIASRKRSRLVLDDLRREGLDEPQLDRVMAPSGLDLGARTPEEIALSVLSEIVLVRRGGTGVRMRDKLVEEPGKRKLAVAGN